MKNLSTEFKRALATSSKKYLAYADITWSSTESAIANTLSLTNAEIWSNGFSYENVISNDDEFTALGSAFIGTAKLVINNMDERYNDYDFTNAEVVLRIGMELPYNNGTRIEKHKIGTYHVDEVTYNGALITLSLLDNMEQFDRPYSSSSLVYPATLGQIMADVCTCCGMQFNTPNFPHYTFEIPERPDDENVSFRNIVSWIATMTGCFAMCNPDGALELKWFDQQTLEQGISIIDGGTISPWSTGETVNGGTISPWSTGETINGGEGDQSLPLHIINSLYSQTVALDDTIITGIAIQIDKNKFNNAQSSNESQSVETETNESETNESETNESETDDDTMSDVYMTGTTGYVITISGNKLITTSNVATILEWLGTQLIGLRFRKLDISHADDPSIEVGDIALVYDRKGRGYATLVTRVSFQIGSPQELVCGASTPLRNSAKIYSEQTRNMLETRKMLKQQKTAYELAIEDLGNRLSVKEGLYATVEQTESGNIYYLHDQPLLADSKIVWKMTKEAWGVTTDYKGENTVWNGGMTVNGDVIARILTSIGVNADWINAGHVAAEHINAKGLKVVNNNNATTFEIDSNGNVKIIATTFSLSDGSTINGIAQTIATNTTNSAITNLSQTDIFNKLTNNGTAQGIYMLNGQLYINMSYLQSGILSVSKTVGNQSQETFYVNASTGEVRIKPTTFSLSDGSTINSIAQSIAEDAAEDAIDDLSQTDIFNKLTNNGEAKGIYMVTVPNSSGTGTHKELYISLDYLGTGILQVYKGTGNNRKETFYVNASTGDVRICPTTFSLSDGSTIESISREIAEEVASDAASGAVTDLSQTTIFNKLTNNGEAQGIYMLNVPNTSGSGTHKELFINLSYLGTGIFQVYSGTGNNRKETFYVNGNTGEVRICPTTFSLSNGSTIQSIANAAAANAVSGIKSADELTQADIINILKGTKNNAIYASNGQIYINATYLQSLSVSADQINVNDLSAIGATIGGFTIDARRLRAVTNERLNYNGERNLGTYFNIYSSASSNELMSIATDVEKFTYNDDGSIKTYNIVTVKPFEVTYEGLMKFTNSYGERRYPAVSNDDFEAFITNYKHISKDGYFIKDNFYGSSSKLMSGILEFRHSNTSNYETSGTPTLSIGIRELDTINALLTYKSTFTIAKGTPETHTSGESCTDVIMFGTKITAYAKLDMNNNDIINVPSTFGSSDRRLKTNIQPIQQNVIQLLTLANVVSFDWIKSKKHVGAGLIAQEVEEYLPELIHVDEDGMYSLNYAGFIPYLIKAVQEQQEEIKEKDHKILELENRVNELELRLERLESLISNII